MYDNVKNVCVEIGGVAPNTPSTYVEGSYVLPTVVEALCERLNA